MLHYPFPVEGEFPLGFLRRLASINGYDSVETLSRSVINRSEEGRNIHLYGKSKFAGYLKEAYDALGFDIRTFFFADYGPTKAQVTLVSGVAIPTRLLSDVNSRRCPMCIKNGEVEQWYIGLNFVDVCLKHCCLLKSSCRHCGVKVGWSMADNECRNCGESNQFEVDFPAESLHFPTILISKFGESDTIFFQRLYRLLAEHRYWDISDFTQRRRLLGYLIDILVDGITAIPPYVDFIEKSFPRCPSIIRLSPLVVDSGLTSVLEACRPIYSLTEQIQRQRISPVAVEDFLLPVKGVSWILGVSERVISSLVSHGLVSAVNLSGRRWIDGPSLVSMLSNLAGLGVNVNSDFKAIGLTSVSDRVSLIDKLQEVLRGQRRLASLSFERGFVSVQVEYLIKTVDTPNLLTVTQVAAQLGSYSDVVRRLAKLKFFDISSMGSLGIRISKESLNKFVEKYVLVGTLAKQYGYNTTTLAARLAALGVNPVSGPKIDGNLITVFLKSDTKNLTPEILAASKKVISSSGRKRAGEVVFDVEKYMTSTEVCNLLQIPQVELSKWVKTGHLTEVMPVGCEWQNRRFFLRTNIANFCSWLNSLVPLNVALEKIGCTESIYINMFRKTGYIKEVRFKSVRLLENKDVDDALDLHQRYCLLSEADSITGGPPRHHQNLVRTERITRIHPSEHPLAGLVSLISRAEIRR